MMRLRQKALLCLVAGMVLGGCLIDFEADPAPRADVPLGPAPEIHDAVTPPPITGGTLLVTGDTAVAADPDRDRIFIAALDVASRGVLHDIALEPGDEPGRIAEDGAGRVHVALRRGGAIVDIELATGEVLGRRPVCAAPRGIVWDSESDSLHVACVSGDLVTLPAAGGEPTRRVRLDDDLRDIVIDGPRLLVSRFRNAEVLVVDRAGGALVSRVRPEGLISRETRVNPITGEVTEEEVRFAPTIAWRMVPALDGGGGALLVHQRSMASMVETEPNPVTGEPGYGGGGGGDFDRGFGGGSCGSPIVHAAVTRIRAGERPGVTSVLEHAVLPVDVVQVNAGFGSTRVAVVAAGNDSVASDDPTRMPITEQVLQGDLAAMLTPGTCFAATAGGFAPSTFDPEGRATLAVGQAVAGSVWRGTALVVQSREPAGLYFEDGTFLDFGAESAANTGHSHFHRQAGAALACASCHAEGGDDGHTWTFAGLGPRRTQTFRGGLRGTEPFHWDGELADFEHLVDEVMVRRMGAPGMWSSHTHAVLSWVDTIPLLPHEAPADTAAVARGDTLFHDPDVGCADCHSGSAMTNNQTVNVGTGLHLQVPSLRGVAFRSPYLHDGCAQTLRDRFGACGGGDDHGQTSTLSESQVSDLVAYLETL